MAEPENNKKVSRPRHNLMSLEVLTEHLATQAERRKQRKKVQNKRREVRRKKDAEELAQLREQQRLATDGSRSLLLETAPDRTREVSELQTRSAKRRQSLADFYSFWPIRREIQVLSTPGRLCLVFPKSII